MRRKLPLMLKAALVRRPDSDATPKEDIILMQVARMMERWRMVTERMPKEEEQKPPARLLTRKDTSAKR